MCGLNACRKYSPSDDSWTKQGPKPRQLNYAATGYMQRLGLIMAGGQDQPIVTYGNELYTTFDGIEFTVSLILYKLYRLGEKMFPLF